MGRMGDNGRQPWGWDGVWGWCSSCRIEDDGVLREAVVLGVAKLQLGHDDDQVMTEYIRERR